MIRNYNLIRAILHEPWFISPADAQTMAPLLLSVFKPEHFAMDPVTRTDMAKITYTADVGTGGTSSAASIGVIKISGALSKYSSWCGYGMEEYGSFIRDFERDTSIVAIVLDIDSPGGTVVGTEELGEIIRNCSKPVIGFVSDMACSAAYWLASCCDEIIANNTTAEVGSIGVMCTYRDMSKYFEKQGIKNHIIYAPQSTDKNKESRDVQAGNYTLAKENLSTLADKFISIVKTNRSNVTDDQLTGKVFFAKDVIGSLIDSIGTFESAITRAVELSEISENNNHKNNNSMSKKPLNALAAAAGVETLESADGSISLTAEMAEAVDTALATATATANATQESADATALATAQARITELESENATLKAAPGAEGASVTKETDAHADEDAPAAQSFGSALKAAREFKNKQNQ